MNQPAKWVIAVRDWCAEQGVTDVAAQERLLRIVYDVRVKAISQGAADQRRKTFS